MDKIYLKDNYIVTELGGVIAVFPKNYSSYSESSTGFYINSTFPVNNQRTVYVDFTRVTSVYNEAGTVAYSIATLRSFLLLNTGFKSPSGGSGGSTITVGTTPVTSGTDGRVFFQSGGVVQQDSSLFWDNTNKRLGVGTSTPVNELDIIGTTRIVRSGSTAALDVFAATVYNPMTVNSSGTTLRNNGSNPSLIANDFSVAAGQVGIRGRRASTLFNIFKTATSDSFSIINGGTGVADFIVLANGNVSVGATTAGARLDVRAQGALSTDIAFRVRNSADTANLVQFRGNGSHIIGDGTWGITINNTTANHLVNGNIAFVNNIDIRGNITHTNGVSDISFRTTQAPITSGYSLNPYYERFVFGSTTTAGFGSGNPSRFIGIVNGTAPNGVITDSFVLYSADIVAGNAAPHFRTENGSIIKLFKGAALTASDGTLANAVTRIAELESRLQAHGLIA